MCIYNTQLIVCFVCWVGTHPPFLSCMLPHQAPKARFCSPLHIHIYIHFQQTHTQGYRTGAKQRLFYSAKLHPELAKPPSPSPSPSPTGDSKDSSSSNSNPSPSNGDDARGTKASSSRDLFFASLPKPTGKAAAKVGEKKELVISYCANVLGDWPAPADYTPRFLRVVLQRREEGKGEKGASAGRQGDL
jgi:hypothetical protein